MNNLFNQYSNGVVKYVGREFTRYENLSPAADPLQVDWNQLTQKALGGIPLLGSVTDEMIEKME